MDFCSSGVWKELESAFEHLTDRDPEEFWTSGQWVSLLFPFPVIPFPFCVLPCRGTPPPFPFFVFFLALWPLLPSHPCVVFRLAR